jgi:hypothetical protein
VLRSCTQIVAAPANHAPAVITFCNNIKPMQAAENKTSTAPAAGSGQMFATVPPDAMLSYNLIGL